MKKLFVTFFMLISVVSSVMADHWTKPQPYDYPDETVLYLYFPSMDGTLEVGAFVNGTCRDVQTEVFQDPNYVFFGMVYRLRVRGNLEKEKGSTITLKFYHMASDMVYKIARTFTFDGESHGTFSNPIELPVLFATNIYVESPIFLAIGESFNLRENIFFIYNNNSLVNTVSPIDEEESPVSFMYERRGHYYEKDENDMWEWAYYFDLDETNGVIKALHETDDAEEDVSVEIMTPNGMMRTSVEVVIAKENIPVTSISCDVSELKVYVNEDIRPYVKPHLHFLPDNATNQLFTEEEIVAEGKTPLIAPLWHTAIDVGDTEVRFVSKSDNTKKTDPVTLHVMRRPDVLELLKDTLFLGEGKNVIDGLFDGVIEVRNRFYDDRVDSSLTIECIGPSLYDSNFITNHYGTCKLHIRATAMDKQWMKVNGEWVLDYEWVDVVLVVKTRVTGIEASETTVYVQKGDDVYKKLRAVVSVVPADASNPDLVFTPKNNNGYIDDKGIALKEGQLTVNVASADEPKYNVDITVIVMGDLFFTLKDVTVSKFGTADVTIAVSTTIDGMRVMLTPEEHENTDWGAVASVERLDDTGLKWRFRGRYFGNYEYGVTYDGSVGKKDANTVAKAKLVIPVEYEYEAGWNWLSLPVTTKEKKSVSISAESTPDFTEVRSFDAEAQKDPTMGWFGDLTKMETAGGAYKVKASKAGRLNLGSGELVKAPNMVNVVPGYNWLVYPHEVDHSISAIGNLLGQYAVKGDLIVGRDFFAYYTGAEWEAPDAFKFKVGQGYLYFSNSEIEHPILWGNLGTPPEEEAPARPTVWQYDNQGFADVMPVVASLYGIDSPADYTVGAFVNGECRGLGVATSSQHLFINIAGKTGEKVSFRLYDELTGAYYDIPDQLTIASRAGTMGSPVVLHPNLTGIAAITDGAPAIAYTNSGINVTGLGEAPTVQLTDAAGRTLLTVCATTLALPQLPRGVYVVRASNGSRSAQLKITR